MGEVRSKNPEETTMKKSNLIRGLAGLALAIAVSGCHHHPANVTPMPGSEAPQAPPPTSGNGFNNNNIPPANPLPPENNPTVTAGPGGIPASADGLWNHPHTEDRQKLADDTIHFDFDSATIKPSEESKLQDVANFLKGNPGDALRIEGNCDERGTEKYNLSLGDRRSLAAREYLANLGVDPMRIQTVTFGASKPVDPGHDEAAWSKNRRDEFVVLIPQNQ